MVGDFMKRIDIAKDFSDTPLGRYPADGPFSGERFREEFLCPALKENDFIAVAIDGTEGYGSSFLDEAFGGLVRKGYYSADQLEQLLKIECNDPDYAIYRELIWKYVKQARKQ
jgi:hypothetical protein